VRRRPVANHGAGPGVWLAFMNDRSAAEMIEFAIVAPVYLLFFFAILGAGFGGFFQVSLDDSVRNAARQIQIDGPAAVSGNNFVTAVCNEFGTLANGCTANLTYAVQASPPYNSTTPAGTGFSALTPATLSSSGTFTNSFFGTTPYADNVNILVQVAYPMPFKIPYLGFLFTQTKSGAVVATTTSFAEPY
jgi:Flp pilus assembly protein TadG